MCLRSTVFPPPLRRNPLTPDEERAVEQVDHLGREVRHLEHGMLIGEIVTAIDRFVKVLVLAISLLARNLVAGVDPALGGHGMCAARGFVDAKRFDVVAQFGQ